MKYRYTAEEKVIVWLDSFEVLTYQQKIKIISAVQPLTKMVADFEECTDALLKIIPRETLNALKDTLADGDYLCSLLSKLEKEDIFFITLLSPEYPQSLANISAPPIILYCKGNRNLLKSRRFAIVGSRRTLTWAQAFTRELSANICKHFTMVTGLAEGGDLAAIEGVLQSCKNTENDGLDAPMPVISVLAYGFDHVYPAEHADILKTVAKHGLVLTEHRPEVKPQKFLFPVRNRIIAGLSEGTLVVSAGKRSGASITATYALEYGRDVFAIPYNPKIPSGEGCNALLKSGAFPVDCIEDILAHYSLECTQNADMPPLNNEENKIFSYLKEVGEAHVEKISAATEIPLYLLGGLLTELEVKGYLVRAGGNRYTAIKN